MSIIFKSIIYRFKWVYFILALIFLSEITSAQTTYSKAPLYWDVYEYNYLKQLNGQPENYIPESVLLANIDWVNDNLKSSGYNMITIDGWGDTKNIDANGYRLSHSSHWQHDYAWWAKYLQNIGMNLGMYDNPLWINVNPNDDSTMIAGTNIPVSSLIDTSEHAAFTWVQVERPGAEQYVKGCIHHYADMGINFLRIDFLSWYETGQDRNMGTVGTPHPRADYVTALRWMREEADANGMFLSLVMTNLINEGAAEKIYGNMFRVDEDVATGSWNNWSAKDRGIKRTGWSIYADAVDGLTYWSYLSTSDSVKLDPDFIRLNTFANDDEKKSVISLALISGSPIGIADEYNTIGTDIWLYMNTELLNLKYDNFVGKPLTNDPTNSNSQVWTGQLSNGDWIVGLFNREDSAVNHSINFNTLGITGNAHIRDLWLHSNLPDASSFSTEIPAHGCRVIEIAPLSETLTGPGAMFVQSLSAGIQNISNNQKKGYARVKISDINNNPVTNANVTISFSEAFNESDTASTDSNGIATVYTSMSDTGIFKINACVINVSKPAYIYAADRNVISCVGEKLFVAGTYDGWALHPMSFRDGCWQKDTVLLQTGSYMLKFANTDNWTGTDWGNATGLAGTAKVTTGGAANLSFNISSQGFYDISFNDSTLNYIINQIHISRLDSIMFVGGTWTNWTMFPMTFEGTNWEFDNLKIPAGSQQLKFANTNNFSGNDWGDASGLSGTAILTTGGKPDITFTIPTTGYYTILFNDISLVYSIASSTSVPDIKNESTFKLYPDPANNFITLNISDNLLGSEYSLTNSLGLLVKKGIINNEYMQINLQSLSKGIYILAITNPSQSIRKLIIKE